MQIISMRLARLFSILIEKNKPVSISELADILEVSRRTVFRELENADSVLNKYDLTLETSIKEGLYLRGNSTQIQIFSKEISSLTSKSSISKEDRRKTLAFAILNSYGYQKLYYYSRLLEVSEATLSLDLDILEKEFKEFDVTLDRKKGIGVAVLGLEKNIRKALVSYMAKASVDNELLALKYNFPPITIEEEVREILSFLALRLDWITPDSLKLLEFRLCVQIARVKSQQFVKEDSLIELSGVLNQLSRKIADEIENRFAIDLPKDEVVRIAKGLISARAKQKNPISEQDEKKEFLRVQSLTFSLIERFDTRIAPMLKMNDEFIRGLNIHLWSAIERIKNGYEILDPLNGQIKEEYPDIYYRTKDAATILEDEFLKKVPESEIACLSAHFGAAVMQIGRDKLKRRLRVGIVCIGGIGVSYMLNSQVKKRFSSEIITEISEYNNKSQWEKNDFIISTIPLADTDKIVINVNPILTGKDYESIRNKIETLKSQSFEITVQNDDMVTHNIDRAKSHLNEIEFLLKNFKKLMVDEGHDVSDLAKFAGYRFGNRAEDGELIFNGLMDREKLSSQIIVDLKILFLHCITDGVKEPSISLLSPGGRKIYNENGDFAITCVSILIPKSSSQDLKEAIGLISSALIEDEGFLSDVINEEENAIYKKIEEILRNHLSIYFKNMFK